MMALDKGDAHDDIGRGTDSLLNNYEVVLSPLIGFLSKFIIKKQFEAATNGGIKAVDHETVEHFMDLVLSEVTILIGPIKVVDLKKDLLQVNELFYESEGEHEK